MKFAGILLLAIAIIACSAQHPEDSLNKNRHQLQEQLKSIKKGEKYQNYRDFPMMAKGSFWGMMKEWVGAKTIREPKEKLDYKPVNPDSVFSGSDNCLRVTWLGHSSFIVEIDGLRILLDPVLSNNTSPVPWLLSVRRFQKGAPISIKEMPPVDAAIISHDHYDHLDKKTIKGIHEKVGRFIVPMGLDKYLVKWGVPANKVTALDWSENISIKQCTVTALPAQHFSGRNGFGGNKTLWASWSITGPRHKLYFSGDTGYHGPTFRRIGELHGPFDLVILDAGQFGQYWPHVHMFPEEAAKAFIELKGKAYFPAHWGSFNLSPHNWYDPIEGAVKAAAEKKLNMAIPYPGETMDIGKELPVRQWWKQSKTGKAL